MLKENRRRLEWQLGLLILFWGLYCFTLVVQMYHLPKPDLDPLKAYYDAKFAPNPYSFYPWEYNPFNNRMTLVES